MIGNKLQVLEWLNKEQGDKRYKCDEFTETRSMAQHRLYFARLTSISNAFTEKGGSIGVNDLHEVFKIKFIPNKYKTNKLTKKRYKQEKSTTSLSKVQFSKYLKDIDGYLFEMFDMIVLRPTELREYTN